MSVEALNVEHEHEHEHKRIVAEGRISEELLQAITGIRAGRTSTATLALFAIVQQEGDRTLVAICWIATPTLVFREAY